MNDWERAVAYGKRELRKEIRASHPTPINDDTIHDLTIEAVLMYARDHGLIRQMEMALREVLA